MMDQNGYLELVLYPSPISMFSVTLLPFIFNKQRFLKMATLYSLGIYWADNCVFLFAMGLQLFFLVPYNYLKIAFQLVKLTFTMVSQSEGPAVPFELSSKLLIVHIGVLCYLLPLWLIMGPLFLIYAFLKDFYYVFQSLRVKNNMVNKN